MNTIRSALLWAAGIIYFLLFFLIIATGLPRTIYSAVRVLARIQLLIVGLRVRVYEHDRFDRRHNCLIMGNHESMFYAFAIPTALPMHAVGIEADYHFSIPLWGYLTGKWGNIPITRENRARAIKPLDNATRVLKAGTSIVVLPEGHRTLTGKVGPFKKGPFHLALAARAYILPFAVSGLYEYRSKQDGSSVPERPMWRSAHRYLTTAIRTIRWIRSCAESAGKLSISRITAER